MGRQLTIAGYIDTVRRYPGQYVFHPEQVQQKGQFGDSSRPGFAGKPAEDGSQEPDQSLGPLQVAPQPQQVVRHPAGQIAAASEFGHRLEPAQQAERRHRLVGQDPDVFALLLLRTIAIQGIHIRSGDGQAAGHDAEALAGCTGKYPQQRVT